MGGNLHDGVAVVMPQLRLESNRPMESERKANFEKMVTRNGDDSVRDEQDSSRVPSSSLNDSSTIPDD